MFEWTQQPAEIVIRASRLQVGLKRIDVEAF